MIFPILDGFISYTKAPITWVLFALNLFVFTGTSVLQWQQDESIDKILEDKNLVKTTGSMFSQFVLESPDSYSNEVLALAKEQGMAQKENNILLGGFALSQKKFWDGYKDFEFKGDRIAIEDWRATMIELEKVQLVHPQFLLGVRGLPQETNDFYRWISYQFTHSGLFHFAGNMVYLLIFGAFLEALVGPLALLVTYLMSGAIAAATFLLLSSETSLPLVGASGSISGLMALATVLMWSKPVRYVYLWFMPQKNYIGTILLPAWLTFLVWLIPDMAGFLSSHEFSGGIAFVAHLGGEAAGIITGLTVLALQKFKTVKKEEPLRLAS